MSADDSERDVDPSADFERLVGDGRHPALVLSDTADRLEELADTAELMGDDAAALDWRSTAHQLRLRAMHGFDY